MDQLCKVVLRYTFEADDEAQGIKEAVALYKRAMAWLTDNEKLDHYCYRYINDPERDNSGHIVVVLNNRDTAVMLKLAVG